MERTLPECSSSNGRNDLAFTGKPEEKISVYTAPVSNNCNQKHYSWPDLYDLLTGEAEPLPDNSSEMKALYGSYFVRGDIIKGTRNDSNLGVCYLLVLDIDKPLDGIPLPTPAEIHEKLQDITHSVHSTATPGRSRIVFKVQPYEKEDAGRLTKAVYDFCRSRGLNFKLAGESKTKSQPFFLPQTTDCEAHQAFGQVNGTMFDPSMVEVDFKEEREENTQPESTKHNPMRDFIAALSTGTIHEAAKEFAGWRVKTSDLSTKQIFDELDALIETSCSDKKKVSRWFDGERDSLKKWFQENAEGKEGEGCEHREGEKEEKVSTAQQVIKTVAVNAELKHDTDDTPYAIINTNNTRQVWPLESKQFRNWLGHLVYTSHNIVVNKNVLGDVLNTLGGKAIFDGDGIDVYVRTAVIADSYYLDLCRDDWSIVKVDPGSWQIKISPPNVYFRRTSAMRALPQPTNTSFKVLPELLQKHFNMTEDDTRLIIAFLIECLKPDTEYPIVEITGSPGSGKSTVQEMIREIIDPNKVNLRAAPKTVEDIFVSAANNHLVSYNNLSKINSGMSDALCSLSTGGGHAGRKFYTNTDEEAVDIQKPVCLNGISSLAKQPDLIDRLIRISLQPIPSTENRAKKQIMDAFKADMPMILGSLLDCFCKVLVVLPEVKLKKLPRMADFARLCSALTQVYGWKHDLLETYYENRSVSFEEALESSPSVIAVVQQVEEYGSYEGTIGNLFEVIKTFRTEKDNWVKTPRGLGEKLRIHTPALKAVGIEIYFDPTRHNDGYHVNIKKVGKQRSQRSQRSRNEDNSTSSEQHNRERCEGRERSIPTSLYIPPNQKEKPEKHEVMI